MNAISTRPSSEMSADVLAAVLMQGDLAKLTPQQRVEYMIGVCQTLGLNPTTKPFEFIVLNGKLVMYAKRDCTEQLRKIHKVSVEIRSREVVEGVYVVTALARSGDGRCDESIGAVPIEGLKGENRANAMMKAETKAKRRVTLSICGLGLLDENEVESIPGVQPLRDATPDPEDARPAQRPKIASVTGEVKTKQPEWSPEQKAEAGMLRAQIQAIGGDAADQEFRRIYNDTKYDAPADAIDLFANLLRRWQEIDDQAKAEGAKP